MGVFNIGEYMRKFLEKALSLNVVVLIFVLLGIRNIILGTNTDAAAYAFFAAAALVGLERYLDFKKGPDINAELQKQLGDIKTYVTAMAMKQGMKKEPIEPPSVTGKRWF